jgi:hypothetical protein
MSEKSLSKIISCGHCHNISPMVIVGNVNQEHEYEDPEYGRTCDSGTIYSILECPACHKINIVNYFWHDSMESEDEVSYKFLYPINSKHPLGLPDKILSTYNAAEKVKTIDVNAYAILMRRMLELVCIDRKAKQGTLAVMLKDLADKNEIPLKLVNVAKGLKDFGNIGAHASIGELSEKEIPILNALSKAILEYIYSAPYLATLAEKQLEKVKRKR